MPTVRAKGKTFTFPDGTTSEQMGEAIDSYFAENAQKESVDNRSMEEIYASDVPTLDESGEIIKRPPQPEPETSFLDEVKGAGEAVLTGITGATGGAIGYIGGTLEGLYDRASEAIQKGGEPNPYAAADKVQEAAINRAGQLTYEPRTETGQRNVQALAEYSQNLQPLTGLAPQLAPLSQSARATLPLVRNTARQVKNLPMVKGKDKSVGAMELSQAMVRQKKAENLPTKVDLTLGSATRDPDVLAFEKEMIKQPKLGAPLRARAQQNNQQLLWNLDDMFDETGAQLQGGAPELLGNKITSALTQGYNAAKNATKQAYIRARNSKEAKTVVDVVNPVRIGPDDDPINDSLFGYINKSPEGMSSAVDKARRMAVVTGVAKKDQGGNLVPANTTMGNLERFRQKLKGVASRTEPSEIREESIIRKLIDAHSEPYEGQLYKQARKLRTQQGRKFENRAVVNRLLTNIRGKDDPRVSADQVFKKSVINSSPDEVRFLKRVLLTSGDEGKQAWNEIKGATVRYIQETAESGVLDSNDVRQLSIPKLKLAINRLDQNGRLNIILGNKNATVMRDLMEVAEYINTVPPGTLINNSGTAGTIFAAIREAAMTGTGNQVPSAIIQGLRYLAGTVKYHKIRKKINKSIAGLQRKD